METELLKSLVASGPLALVLGFAVVKLWTRLNKVQEERVKEALEFARRMHRNTQAIENLTGRKLSPPPSQ